MQSSIKSTIALICEAFIDAGFTNFQFKIHGNILWVQINEPKISYLDHLNLIVCSSEHETHDSIKKMIGRICGRIDQVKLENPWQYIMGSNHG